MFEPLEQRQLMSTVQIFAAGNVGAEQIDLSIGGAVVKHFGNLGSGADAGRFVTLSHTVNGPLAASDVRVSFVNDFYDEARDIDHNVRIDAIAIDGVFYQSESPDTFSTGTYRPQDEIVPGFGRGDMLHTNGYFQYSGSTPPVDPGTGSVVKVFAAGEAGQEQIALQIDGSTVKTWGGLGTGADAGQFVTKSYTSAATLTPGQVRVAFVNDAFDATRNVDYNARVDAIEIDGVRYESESSNTFSTGTWLPADEFTAGFGRGDTLHTNGYFEYGASTQPRRAGRIQWVDRTYRVNESAGQVDIQIQRVDGTDGEVSANFVMINETATPGQDFTAPSGTVKFRNGQSTATVTIPILDDALIEGDESFSVSLSAANGGAVLGAPRTRRVEITDNETQVLGNGLLGEYFRRRDFSDLVVRRNDAIVNFEWGTGSPSPLLPADRFAVRWSGQVLPPTTETYTFRTHSDEGVRLWVNGQLVIDKFVNQTARSHTAQVALQAGQKADIVLEYYEHLGDATARLFWSTPTRTESIIPKAVLFSPDAEPVIPPAQFKEEVLLTGLQNPTDVAFTPDGTAYLLSKEGYIQVYRNGELSATRFVDISGIVNKRGDRGGISIAVHPDFANKPYVYMAYTYEPPEAQSHTGLAGPDGGGNRAARVSRFTADAATGFTTAVPGSE
ncbi:MAG: PA14 domain-containing protein, partial [Algisphaera sp.]